MHVLPQLSQYFIFEILYSILNDSGPDGIITQIHILHRCRFICREPDFRPVNYDIFTNQFKISTLAIIE